MEVSKLNIAGVNCEWITPNSQNGNKVVVYLHGGGYVLGNLNTARGFSLLLAKYTGERVLSVDYILAPEHKFPAALEDSLAVYDTLLKKGICAKDIVLM